MNIILITILLFMGIISFIPVIKMNSTKEDTKYQCLKYLMNVTFVWTILIFIERLSPNITVSYYAHLSQTSKKTPTSRISVMS